MLAKSADILQEELKSNGWYYFMSKRAAG